MEIPVLCVPRTVGTHVESMSRMLIMKAIGLDKGSGVPNKTKVGTITKAQIAEIAKTKMPDLNCPTLEAAESQVAGTCRSMGVTVVD